VPLSVIQEVVQRQRPCVENLLAVTVDDGYADFYHVAFPVLRDYGIRATVYLVTDFVDGKTWLWPDMVSHIFLRTKRALVKTAVSGETEYRLDTEAERRAAAFDIKERAKRIPNQTRLELLSTLSADLGVSVPETAPEQYAPLNWDQIREMADAGVDFGAHTRSHPILSRLESVAEADEEIAGCKRRLEDQLQRPVAHFCYPNGRPEDYSRETIEIVKQAGYRSAVTTSYGLNAAGQDPYRLLRLPVDIAIPQEYFERVTAGFRAA
jgi:peptidoglycan/xylan/chitin deacetylase (PgdA/CDA1 family)